MNKETLYFLDPPKPQVFIFYVYIYSFIFNIFKLKLF